jgi:hypothetical protein
MMMVKEKDISPLRAQGSKTTDVLFEIVNCELSVYFT